MDESATGSVNLFSGEFSTGQESVRFREKIARFLSLTCLNEKSPDFVLSRCFLFLSFNE